VNEEEDKDQDEDDSGRDSMDDLPQELKDIHPQLKSRKNKAVSDVPSPSSNSSAEDMTSTITDVQNQVSAILMNRKREAKPTTTLPSKAATSTWRIDGTRRG